MAHTQSAIRVAREEIGKFLIVWSFTGDFCAQLTCGNKEYSVVQKSTKIYNLEKCAGDLTRGRKALHMFFFFFVCFESFAFFSSPQQTPVAANLPAPVEARSDAKLRSL